MTSIPSQADTIMSPHIPVVGVKFSPPSGFTDAHVPRGWEKWSFLFSHELGVTLRKPPLSAENSHSSTPLPSQG